MDVLTRLANSIVVPVVVIDDAKDAVPTAKAIGIHKAREGDDGSARSIRGIAYATTAKKIKELLSKWKDEYKLDL